MLRSLVFASAILFVSYAMAQDAEYTITIKDHKFDPAEITVPANTQVKLIVKNEDASPEEFESAELKREKIISGNSEAIIRVGPLEPGEYPFMGEFHQGSAKGKLIAK